MKDTECVEFLQWSLPHLKMRWPGFRKVRRQVCKRLQHRIDHLNLDSIQEYKKYIEMHSNEWLELDKLCRVTISRFYRDKIVFGFLEEHVLPRLLDSIKNKNETELRVWCAGSGAGEEPYTIALLWAKRFKSHYPDIKLSVVGTEIDAEMIKRAKYACYPYSAIKNLPLSWQESAFKKRNSQYCLLEEYKNHVDFYCQDLRQQSPSYQETTSYHLICCRNLAFTYYNRILQNKILLRLRSNMNKDSVLLIGVHEKLPTGYSGLMPWSEHLGFYHCSETTR